jgi:hypothetical protein
MVRGPGFVDLQVFGVVALSAPRSSWLRRIMFFCSGVFCKGLRRGKGFGSSCSLPLGSAMGPGCAC